MLGEEVPCNLIQVLSYTPGGTSAFGETITTFYEFAQLDNGKPNTSSSSNTLSNSIPCVSNYCRNPTLAKSEDETHTPKVGDLESFGTPECLQFDNKGENTSSWDVLGVIEKVLKCRCPK
jgi:hypothetical protein